MPDHTFILGLISDQRDSENYFSEVQSLKLKAHYSLYADMLTYKGNHQYIPYDSWSHSCWHPRQPITFFWTHEACEKAGDKVYGLKIFKVLSDLNASSLKRYLSKQ